MLLLLDIFENCCSRFHSPLPTALKEKLKISAHIKVADKHMQKYLYREELLDMLSNVIIKS